MDKEEAKSVAKAVASVHGECLSCAAAVACHLDKDLFWIDWFQLIADQTRWDVEALRESSPCHG